MIEMKRPSTLLLSTSCFGAKCFSVRHVKNSWRWWKFDFLNDDFGLSAVKTFTTSSVLPVKILTDYHK